MKLFAFHDVFSTGNVVADLLLLVIFAGGFFVSDYYAIRGAVYLVKNWFKFSRKWQIILVLFSNLCLVVAWIEPIPLVVSAFPFGWLGGFAAIFFITAEFGPASDLSYQLLGIG